MFFITRLSQRGKTLFFRQSQNDSPEAKIKTNYLSLLHYRNPSVENPTICLFLNPSLIEYSYITKLTFYKRSQKYTHVDIDTRQNPTTRNNFFFNTRTFFEITIRGLFQLVTNYIHLLTFCRAPSSNGPPTSADYIE